MKLSVLTGRVGDSDPDIKGITADSRTVMPGFLFAALKGVASDGVDFIPQAEQAGAAAVLAREGVSAGVPVITALEPRQKLAEMAASFYAGCPSFMAGITGTNGKTSTARFASQLWQMLGVGGGSLGTLGVEAHSQDGQPFTYKLVHTTPEPVTLHQALSAAHKADCTHMAMEVSSHGLAQYRADGVRFDVAAFTNITQDHLDYHADFEDYFQAKQRLFTELLKPDGVAIMNKNGAGADALCELLTKKNIRVLTTGQKGSAVNLKTTVPTPAGLDVSMKADGRFYNISLRLLGAFQAENVALAAGIVMASGFAAGEVMPLLTRLEGVPGRMMQAGAHRGAGIYVDYAHTPDAVATALQAARPHTTGKLITIIGAGGDRDNAKRPLMGQAAADYADHVIVTDDNPRSEDPATIRMQVREGAPSADDIGDRAKAIATAIDMLEGGDVLMILGKGHETGQIIGDKVLPFDDAQEVRNCVGD